ncbi:hypothetical protein NDU88_004024 [Pleurodeles waltl]|uniref:Uncharacterized protein n=1 Tax=Pleurodeles waltl TaxID=8319 RepID=A0AAV7SHJ8_PLEWA|nr:hypothetical protein NDU88_004024 [Pleurodeles waltl]
MHTPGANRVGVSLVGCFCLGPTRDLGDWMGVRPTCTTEESWSTPKGRRGRWARSEIKPTKAQSAEECTHLLHKATQFVSNPYSALNELADTEADQDDSSDAGDSHRGPLLTQRSADDI